MGSGRLFPGHPGQQRVRLRNVTRASWWAQVTLGPAQRYSGVRPRFIIAAGAILCLTACGSVRVASGQKIDVIPWIDAVPSMPTPSPTPVIPAGTRACVNRDLRVAFEGGQGLGFGQLTATISFANVSGTNCFLQGVPGFALLDAQEEVIGTTPSGYLITDRSDPVLMVAGGGSRQAYLPFAWPGIDQATGGGPCPSAKSASSVRLQLPGGGGMLAVSVAHAATLPLTIAPCHGLIAVGAFQPAEPAVEPTPTPHPFSYHVALPASVRAGNNLQYTVTFTNVTTSPVVFSDPCPTYHEDLYFGSGATGQPLGKHVYLLNCHAVEAIASHASLTFAMVLDVPASASPGGYTLLWAPDEGADIQDIQRLPITVVH